MVSPPEEVASEMEPRGTDVMSVEGASEGVRQFEKHVLVNLDDLYRAALRLTPQVAAAEDLVQETCVRAFEALDQLKRVSAAKVWVFSILRSTLLRQVEQGPARSPLASIHDIEGSLLTPSEALRDAYENVLPMRQTFWQETRHAILELPLPYREAIVLAHIGGFSYREMAQILGVPVGTVMSRLFRGRRMLRASLAGRRPRDTPGGSVPPGALLPADHGSW
jgi:RNA polymerase sigma-70 factor, ECF subfamily